MSRELIRSFSPTTRAIIEQMVESGEIGVPQLKKMLRAQQHQERVYERPDEIVHERTDTTVEIFIFED